MHPKFVKKKRVAEHITGLTENKDNELLLCANENLLLNAKVPFPQALFTVTTNKLFSFSNLAGKAIDPSLKQLVK